MRFRHAIGLATIVAATLVTAAPAHAAFDSWTGLPGLNSIAGAQWVREYSAGQLPNTMYAATEGDGVWISTTGGTTWSDFSSGLNTPAALAVRTVYTSGSTVYAGTDGGLFSNSGTGWTPVAQGPEDDPAHPVKLNEAVQAVFSPVLGTMLAGVAGGGVYSSSDGGQTWHPPAPGNGMWQDETVWSFASFKSNPAVIFAGTSSGVYRSIDGGSTWTLASDGISGEVLRVYADGTNPNIYYALAPGAIYRSINAGITWSSIEGTGTHAIGGNTARALVQFNGASLTRLYVGTDDGVWAGETGNGPNPGPVTWRAVTQQGLNTPTASNTIIWALTNPTTGPGTLFAGTQSNGGYALTFTLPVNTGLPVVSGTKTVGKTLTATHGTWTGTQTIEYAYQWQRCTSTNAGTCADIDNATDSTYDLQSADQGKYLRVTVTASNDFPTFSLDKASSTVYGSIAANPNTLPGALQQSAASIESLDSENSALPQSGDTLHAYGWLFNPAAASTSYQWLRCDANGSNCDPVEGATGQNYVLTDADVTLTLRVVVTGTNANGSTTLLPSGATNTIFPQAATQTTPAKLIGDAYVGESLISDVGTWKYPGTTYTRQWQRCEPDGSDCETLTDETNPDYTITEDDLGSTLRVEIDADSNEANHFPAPVEVFSPLSAVVTERPVDNGGGDGGNGGGNGGGGQPGGGAPGGGAQPGGAPAPAPVPAPDKTAPALSTKLAASSVKHGGSLKLKFAISEAGTLQVKLQRLVAGRKHGKTCKAGGKKGKKCTAIKSAGTLTVHVSGAGTATLPTKKLAVGSYRALITPVDGAGNHGATKTLSFKVKKK